MMRIVNGNFVKMTAAEVEVFEADRAPPSLGEMRAAANLTKGDFCMALFNNGVLSEDSVVETARGKFPPEFEPLIASMPVSERLGAKLAWAGATHVSRTAPLFLLLLEFYGNAQTPKLTDDQVTAFGDQMFGIAS